MVKYYTRACNFYYGTQARKLIKSRNALPLCGNKDVAFNKLEIFFRNNKKVETEYYSLKDIKFLGKKLKKKIEQNLKKIQKKRKNFLENVNFSTPSIMGILNLTPDSFSDGGKFNSKIKSINHIKQMIKSGANIIDIGGESTRPGSKTLSTKTEMRRVEYILKNFKKKFKKTCLSLDTRKSKIMLQGIKYGIDLINDVSGFTHEKNSLHKLKNFKVAKVLHHMQGTPNTMQKNPKYKNVLLDIYDFFEKNLKKNFKGKNLIIDPGIGFGKTLKHNLTLISKYLCFIA